MLRIHAKTIPHDKQDYETVGNYWHDEDENVDEFRVSDMGNKDYEFLVLIHELIEQHLCDKRGVPEESITSFDVGFEELRLEYPRLIGDMEPGDMISAPYHKEHKFATTIERMIAAELKVDWEKYDKTVNSLGQIG